MSLHDLELKISVLLRRGVVVAGLLLGAGWLVMLLSHGDMIASFQTYHEQGLWENLQWAFLTQDRGLLLSYAGLFVLVLLPVVRVFLTGYLFARQKEPLLSLMAFMVFVILVGSFLLGIDL